MAFNIFSSKNGTPQPNFPDLAIISREERGAYLSLMEVFDKAMAMIIGCRLTIVVEPQGIKLGTPSSLYVVIIPTDDGKKQGHRARSLSIST